MPCGIYEIRSPSGRFYVGSAVDIDRRWTRHRKDLRSGTHGNRKLTRAAAKYGVHELIFSTLLICNPNDLIMYEQAAINALRPAYNIAPNAGNHLGIKRTDAFRFKVSAALRNRPVSQETRDKIGARHKGKKLSPENLKKWRDAIPPVSSERRREVAAFMHTPEAKEKKRLAMIGRSVSQESREKISASLKGRKHSPERAAAISAGKLRAFALQKIG